MKIKAMLTGLVILGSLSMTGCMSSTEEAIDEPNETPTEQEQTTEEYQKTPYDEYVETITAEFEKHGYKDLSLTQVEYFGNDRDTNKLDGRYLLSDDLMYIRVEFNNGKHWTTVKVIKETGEMKLTYTDVVGIPTGYSMTFDEYFKSTEESLKKQEELDNKLNSDEPYEPPTYEDKVLDESDGYTIPKEEDMQVEDWYVPSRIEREEEPQQDKDSWKDESLNNENSILNN